MAIDRRSAVRVALIHPTLRMQCSSLRKSGHVVIKGRACKIVDMSTSKTGKHGHAKVHLVAIDVRLECSRRTIPAEGISDLQRQEA